MQAYLKAVYKCRTDNGCREESLVRCITIPVVLKDVEFYAGSQRSAFKIVAVKVSYHIHDEDIQEIWVSPVSLYGDDDLPLDWDKNFWVWCKEQWLCQEDPKFPQKFAKVHDLVVSSELEDQDAFNAVEALGFANWEADVILNYHW
jgi:hypothetical protein